MSACGAFQPDHRWFETRSASLPIIFNMVHSGGFEPPTARFVAEYSIQLSYECIVRRIIGVKNFLSSLNQINFNNLPIKAGPTPITLNNGGEGGIRTPDTLLRCTPLAGERLRPLGHLSATRGA